MDVGLCELVQTLLDRAARAFAWSHHHKSLLCMCDQHVACASLCKIVDMCVATRLATFSTCLQASQAVASDAAAAASAPLAHLLTRCCDSAVQPALSASPMELDPASVSLSSRQAFPGPILTDQYLRLCHLATLMCQYWRGLFFIFTSPNTCHAGNRRGMQAAAS